MRTPAATCSGARERLTGVWDAARRARAGARFATSELGAAWPAVASQLDNYGDTWVAMQNAACRATRVDGVQPEQVLALRTACLERRRADLAALAGQLERADDGVIARARAAVAALAPIDDCHDQPELLAHAVALRGNAIDGAWQDRLSQIKALFDVGRWREGLAAAAALTRDADAGANPAVRGAAWAWLGQLQFELIDPTAAERSLETALRLTAEAGDDVAAAHVVAGLVLALGQIDGRRAEGLTVAEIGRAHVARAGGDDLLRAELLNARSEVLEELGRRDDARAALTEALALWSAHLPPDDLRIARSTSLLARNRRRTGAYGEADTLYQQALSIYERRIGPDHPTTAQLLDHLAIVAVDLHHFDDAIARSTRAIAIKRRVFGAESSEYADTLSNFGNARFRRGDVDGAVAAWQGSLAIYEARSPGAHEDIARVLGNLGVARSRQGRLDDAAALHRRTLAIRSAHASPAIGQCHDNLGHVLFDRGDYAGAIAEYRLALDADRKNRPRDVFRDRSAIAQALVYSGRCAEARPDLRALIGDIDAQAAAHRTELIEALTSLGRCELEAGNAAVATALLERALATAQPFIDKGDMDPVEIAVAQLEAARALTSSRRPPSARWTRHRCASTTAARSHGAATTAPSPEDGGQSTEQFESTMVPAFRAERPSASCTRTDALGDRA